MAKWNTGTKNGFWKGGRVIASNGYVLIRVGTDHHLSDSRGYAYEHRLIAEQKLGRRLLAGEQIHHLDGNKQNNSPDNIEVFKSRSVHMNHHRTTGVNRRCADEPNRLIECACGCGALIDKFDSDGRPRKYISGHNMIRRTRQ